MRDPLIHGRISEEISCCFVLFRVISWIDLLAEKITDPRTHTKQHEKYHFADL